MIRPYGPADFLSLVELFERAIEEQPDLSFLPGALAAHPGGFLLWQAGESLAGFLFLLGDEIRSLAACYLLPEFRNEEASFLQACFGSLSGVALAMLVSEGIASFDWKGFEAVERLELVQDLARVSLLPPELPPDFLLLSWEDRFLPEVARLLSLESRGTLEGLFLCFPEVASEAACRDLLEKLVEGRKGPFLPGASGVLLAGEEVVGATLMFESAPGEAMLWELVLERKHQAQGLAPMLIRFLQAGVREAGLGRIRFAYCGKNRAVRRLFADETIVERARETMWVWRSDRYRAQRRILVN